MRLHKHIKYKYKYKYKFDFETTATEFVSLSIGDYTLRPPTSAQMQIHCQDKHNYPSTYDIFIWFVAILAPPSISEHEIENDYALISSIHDWLKSKWHTFQLSPTRSLYWNTFLRIADSLCLPSWSKEKAVLEFLCKIVPMRSYWTIGHLSSGLPSESALQWLTISRVARFCERLWVIFFHYSFQRASNFTINLKHEIEKCKR